MMVKRRGHLGVNVLNNISHSAPHLVPQSFDYDLQTQKPVDRWQRAELSHSVVEFVAPTEYMVRPPQPLVYLFLIDVSYQAVNAGILATAAQTILDSLDRIPNNEGRAKLGFITYDNALHFYKLAVSVYFLLCKVL